MAVMRPVWAVAAHLGRPEHTIRTWAQQGRIASGRDRRTGRLLVDLAAAAHIDRAAGRRRRGPTVDYRGFHDLLTTTFGPALLYPCADCFDPAEDWSYDHADPDEQVDPVTGRPYSTKVVHYQPRCRHCHLKLDAPYRPEPAGI